MESGTSEMYQLPSNSWYAGQFSGMTNSFANLTNNLAPFSSLSNVTISNNTNNTELSTSSTSSLTASAQLNNLSTNNNNNNNSNNSTSDTSSSHNSFVSVPSLVKANSTDSSSGIPTDRLSSMNDLNSDLNCSTSSAVVGLDESPDTLVVAGSSSSINNINLNNNNNNMVSNPNLQSSLDLLSSNSPLVSTSASFGNSFGSQFYTQFPATHSFGNNTFTPPTPPSPNAMSASNQAFGQFSFSANPIYERFSAAAAAYNSFPSPSYSVGGTPSMIQSSLAGSASNFELNRACSQPLLSANSDQLVDLSSIPSHLSASTPTLLHHAPHAHHQQSHQHLQTNNQTSISGSSPALSSSQHQSFIISPHSYQPTHVSHFHSNHLHSGQSSTNIPGNHLNNQVSAFMNHTPTSHSPYSLQQQQPQQLAQHSQQHSHHLHLHHHQQQQQQQQQQQHPESQITSHLNSLHSNHSELSAHLSDDSQTGNLNIASTHILSHVKQEEEDDLNEEDEHQLNNQSMTSNGQSSSSTASSISPSSQAHALASSLTGESSVPFDWMKKAQYGSQPQPGKTRTRDKYRVVYSDTQRLELEKEFHYSRYITIRRKSELASMLGLSERQVKIWFQNRRAKDRKQFKKHRDDSCFKSPQLSNSSSISIMNPMDPSSLVLSSLPSIN